MYTGQLARGSSWSLPKAGQRNPIKIIPTSFGHTSTSLLFLVNAPSLVRQQQSLFKLDFKESLDGENVSKSFILDVSNVKLNFLSVRNFVLVHSLDEVNFTRSLSPDGANTVLTSPQSSAMATETSVWLVDGGDLRIRGTLWLVADFVTCSARSRRTARRMRRTRMTRPAMGTAMTAARNQTSLRKASWWTVECCWPCLGGCCLSGAFPSDDEVLCAGRFKQSTVSNESQTLKWRRFLYL